MFSENTAMSPNSGPRRLFWCLSSDCCQAQGHLSTLVKFINLSEDPEICIWLIHHQSTYNFFWLKGPIMVLWVRPISRAWHWWTTNLSPNFGECHNTCWASLLRPQTNIIRLLIHSYFYHSVTFLSSKHHIIDLRARPRGVSSAHHGHWSRVFRIIVCVQLGPGIIKTSVRGLRHWCCNAVRRPSAKNCTGLRGYFI